MRLRLIQGIPSRVAYRTSSWCRHMDWVIARRRRAGPVVSFVALVCVGREGGREDPGSRVRTVHVATDHFLEETPFNGRHRCISCSSQPNSFAKTSARRKTACKICSKAIERGTNLVMDE